LRSSRQSDVGGWSGGAIPQAIWTGTAAYQPSVSVRSFFLSQASGEAVLATTVVKRRALSPAISLLSPVSTVVRLHAYAPPLFAMLPMLLTEASDGHFEGLMAQSRMIEQLVGEQISIALQLSVSCAEDAPGLVADPADSGTLLGTDFVDYLQAQCSTWPRGTVPSDFHAPVTASAPTLLLSGEFDPVTPPRYGGDVARTLRRSRHFALRGQGHGVLGVGCVPQLVARFIATADARGLDGRCLDTLNYAPPFAGAYGWEP